MANIINIFHKDILPTDVPAEYEMAGPEDVRSEVLFYRRGLHPLMSTVHGGMRVNIPLLPIDSSFSSTAYRSNAELKREIKKFVIESIPYMRTQEMRITEACKLAQEIYALRGTYLCHVLFSSDLENRIGPVYDQISPSKCIDIGRHPKNSLIFLPEEIFTGILSLKDQSIDAYRSISGYTNNRGRFGVMLSKDNALMCRVTS